METINLTSPFWQGAREGKLCLQRCSTCSHVEFYPKKYCSHCLNDSLEWFESSGLGMIHTFTVVHRAPSKKFAEKVPYVVALIDLNEGARMMANILSPIEEVKIGSLVEVIFEETEDKVLPQFKISKKDEQNE